MCDVTAFTTVSMAYRFIDEYIYIYMNEKGKEEEEAQREPDPIASMVENRNTSTSDLLTFGKCPAFQHCRHE